MITDLPAELQECIYNKLCVKDRVMFKMAMPKSSRIMFKSPSKEKRLGVLVKSIQKKKLASLTKPIKQFLKTCDRHDPTIEAIADVLPEARTIHAVKDMRPNDDIVGLISEGIVTAKDLERQEEDLRCLIQNSDWELKKALLVCKPSTFDVLVSTPGPLREHIISTWDIFSLLNYENGELIEHIKANGQALGMNVQAFIDRFFVHNIHHDYFVLCTRLVKMALKHLPLSEEHLDMIWLKNLEAMNMEIIDAIDTLRKSR